MKLLGFLFTLPALAAPMPSAYSCDRIVEGAISGRTMTTKLYVSGSKVRLESGSTVTILRKDRNVTWILNTQRRTYVEASASAAVSDPLRDPFEGATRQVLGQERIDGYVCTKVRLTRTDVRLGPINAIVWTAEQTGMPVRTETNFRGNRIVESRKNIQIGPQPDRLFEIPAGYTKVSLGKAAAASAKTPPK